MKTLVLPATVSAFAVASCVISAPAIAVSCEALMTARFVEGAPRDRFHFDNKANEGTEIVSLSIDLKPSKGRLIFDTQNGGSGVEVFQLFRDEAPKGDGDSKIRVAPDVADGAESLKLDFDSFPAGKRYSFSIDVDDQLTNSALGQIRVAGSEMQGAVINATFRTPDNRLVFSKTAFDANSRATVCKE